MQPTDCAARSGCLLLKGKVMHIFHKWEPIMVHNMVIFLGERYDRPYHKFRQCKVCGRTEQSEWCSAGSWWSTLNETETSIINRRTVRELDGVLYIKETKC